MRQNETTKTIQDKLHQYIDSLNDFQLRIVLGFIKKLFNITD